MQISLRRRWGGALTVAAVLMATLIGQAVDTRAAHADYGAMIHPVSGYVQYLYAGSAAVCGRSVHDGVDINGNGGSTVIAAAGGTVRVAGNYYGYGQTVIIDHPGGYNTLYGHMQAGSIAVQAGAQVQQGQALGRVGNTGQSFGEHLHFWIKRGTQNITNEGYTCHGTVARGAVIPMDLPGLSSSTPPAPPADRDGDGVPDYADVCFDRKGFAAYGGCPIPRSANSTDFNGDGKADTFFAHPSGQWWVSDSATSSWRIINTANIAIDLLQFADFDGDGKDDVFYPHPDGRWMVSYGGDTSWTTINNAPGAAGEMLQLGDFNGDGKADVFWPNPNGQWWISYGGNTGWVSVSNNVPSTGLAVADFNGDGKDDIFWANPNGQWWVSDSATSPWHIANSANVRGDELKFGDLNGDGKDDVFWANPSDGKWWISSAASSSWEVGQFANVHLQELQLADVTGDGKKDVFWQNPAVNQWWISSAATSPWQSISGTFISPDLLVIR